MHGNGVKDPNRISEMVRQARAVPGYTPKPILFNEDDHFQFRSAGLQHAGRDSRIRFVGLLRSGRISVAASELGHRHRPQEELLRQARRNHRCKVKLEDFRDVIRRIPRGSIMTYGEVAAAAGHRGAARQVVWALHNCATGYTVASSRRRWRHESCYLGKRLWNSACAWNPKAYDSPTPAAYKQT